MNSAQDRWVLGAIVLSESAWVFALLSVGGVAFGRETGAQGSFLSWPAVLAIMTASVLLGRSWPSFFKSPESVQWARFLAGLAVVYVTVASHLGTGFGLDLVWIVHLFSGTQPDGWFFRAVSGAVMGVLLWWRGSRLAASEFPTETMAMSFRVGILALALATVVDLVSPQSLSIFPVIFVFFAAGLAGLSVGHILPDTQQAEKGRSWTGVVAVVVSAVLLIGLVFSFLQRDLLSFTSTAFESVYTAVVFLVLWGFVIPLAWLYTQIINFIRWLYSLLFSGEQVVRETEGFLQIPTSTLDVIQSIEGEGEPSIIIQVLAWAALAAAVVAVMYLGSKVIRGAARRRPRQSEGERESIREGANISSDLARLLLGLLPDRFLKGRQRREYHIPDGSRGIVEVLRIYYEILTMAEENGLERHPDQTALEFRNALEGIFPQSLVRLATDSFNRACYGHEPASEERIIQMRSALEGLSIEPA